MTSESRATRQGLGLGRRFAHIMMVVLALVVAGASSVMVGASASADPATTGGTASTSSTSSTTPTQQYVNLTWDSDVVELDWQGQRHTTAQSSFLGNHVVSPGDRVWRSATIRNVGPSDGVATVEIVGVVDSVSGTTITDLDSALVLGWDVAGQADQTVWADILSTGGRTLGSYPVKQGDELPLTIGFSFPTDSTAGHEAAQLGDVLSFNVRVTMRGDTGTPPSQTPLPPTGPVVHSGGLALFESVPGGPWWLLLPVAGFVWLAWKRRRDDESEEA